VNAIGLVRFGSRADLWLPRDSELLVKVGDPVKGGSSVVAYWPPRAKSTQTRAQNTSFLGRKSFHGWEANLR